jgi:hypothetical protein
VDEESHRDEMNAAIRAQRERGAVPRSMLPAEDDPAVESPPPEPPATLAPPPKHGLFGRLFRN